MLGVSCLVYHSLGFFSLPITVELPLLLLRSLRGHCEEACDIRDCQEARLVPGILNASGLLPRLEVPNMCCIVSVSVLFPKTCVT